MTDARLPSVVIADNNEFYRRLLGDFYRERGYDARVARDGIEALEMLETSPPDLLVLDLIMPRLDGARLCAHLRTRDRYARLPVVILSGILADEIDGVETIQADAYIAKMPLEQIGPILEKVSRDLVSRGSTSPPILSGFERMYRREVVRELLEERRSAQAIRDSLSEGILELSDDHRLLAGNRAFETIAGRAASRMLSRPIEEIFPDGRPVLETLFADAGTGADVAAATIRHAGRDLTLKLHRLGPAPGGEPQGYTLLVEDVTGRTRAEREREQLRARLAHSEKMSAIGMFVAGAAHELNNPLTSVLGYAQLLAGRHKDAPMARELEKIVEGASRCKTIVESLMTFARAHRPEKVPVDIPTLIEEALSGHGDRLQESGIELAVRVGRDLPRPLADPARLVQALSRVIDNAVRALAAHPGRRHLGIEAVVTEGRIRIDVSDTGPGIPADVLSRIFEPFFTTRQVGQGSGLGLSVAYGIMTAHAGRIAARNRPEGGATVTLEIPVVSREIPAAPPPAAGPPLADPSRRRILIVDDEPVVQELLVDILDSQANAIETAGSGVEALRRIRAGDFDLILLDLKMPDMTGQQLWRELERQRPELLGRVIFITADTLTGDVRGFLDRAGSPCLTKPFTVDAVLRQVEAILREAPSRR